MVSGETANMRTMIATFRACRELRRWPGADQFDIHGAVRRGLNVVHRTDALEVPSRMAIHFARR